MKIFFKRSTIRRRFAFSRQFCLALATVGAVWAGSPDAGKIVTSQEAKFRIETLADGLDSPWGLVLETSSARAAITDGRR
jgi:hypothetical protein